MYQIIDRWFYERRVFFKEMYEKLLLSKLKLVRVNQYLADETFLDLVGGFAQQTGVGYVLATEILDLVQEADFAHQRLRVLTVEQREEANGRREGVGTLAG